MTKKPIAVALGDIHLDNRIWTKIHGITGDSIVGYNAFLDVAIRLGVPAVIVGDLFDVAKPPPDLVDAHRKAMDKCKAAGIPVYVIQGNHDKQLLPWATASHEHPIYVGEGNLFQLGSHKAQAYDYMAMDEIEPLMKKATAEILFLHQAVRQALGFENAWNADLDWISDAVKLTVIGDIHKPMDFKLDDGRLACYTGAGHPRDIDQVGPKSVVVINDDRTYTRESIPSRHIKRFRVHDPTSLAEVQAWVENSPVVEGLEPFAWIFHTPEFLAALSLFQREMVVSHRAYVYREPLVLEDEEDSPTHVTSTEDDISPQALLTRIVKQEDKELFSFVSALIDERTPLIDVLTTRKDAC